MKIIGFSSGAAGREGNVDRMVKGIMSRSGYDPEFVKLTGLSFSGCRGCAHLCAGPRECQLEDDLLPFYHKIREADAVVIGSPVYFNAVSGTTIAFIERFFGYRHLESALKGKPFVLAVSSGIYHGDVLPQFRRMLAFFEVNILDAVVYASDILPCMTCGLHRGCTIGGLYARNPVAARSLEITPEMFRVWEDHPETVLAVERAASRLRKCAQRG
jgi:multimeric flavodoxin WrbA